MFHEKRFIVSRVVPRGRRMYRPAEYRHVEANSRFCNFPNAPKNSYIILVFVAIIFMLRISLTKTTLLDKKLQFYFSTLF
jgi:hypothetical protein